MDENEIAIRLNEQINIATKVIQDPNSSHEEILENSLKVNQWYAVKIVYEISVQNETFDYKTFDIVISIIIGIKS